MATYTFGATGATNLAEGTYGFLTDFTYSYSGDEATAQNASGNVGVHAMYNKVTEVTCTYVFDSTKTLPDVGDEIVIGAIAKYSVISVEKVESNVDYERGTITLKKYTSVGIPAN